MRKLPLSIVAVLFAVSPAGAQVTVDLHALEAVPATKPAPALRSALPRPAAPARPTAAVAPTVAPAVAPVATAPGPAASPQTPPAPTPALPLTPPVVATAPTPPPPAVEAPKIGPSVRILFAAEQAELGKEGVASIESAIETAYAAGTSMFSVVAYASGKPDDPSSARRLSLARALAVRTVLQNNSVPSRKIVVRALGNQPGDGPPDRVDLVASAGGTP